MSKILIVDDEPDITEIVKYNLEKEGFRTIIVRDGNEALQSTRNNAPDLIILDLMLPGINGLEVCRILKRNPETENIPIIMLTAKTEESDRVVGLEMGADDYMTKPFSVRELAARVRTVLRRVERERAEKPKPIMKFKNLTIDALRHEVMSDGKKIDLTSTEFKLLSCLASNAGILISRDRLLDVVWGVEIAIETRTVDVHIKRLREKLKSAGKYIVTIRGEGYRFDI
jgi:phosphate regulon transcriptional regulator PhoB